MLCTSAEQGHTFIPWNQPKDFETYEEYQDYCVKYNCVPDSYVSTSSRPGRGTAPYSSEGAKLYYSNQDAVEVMNVYLEKLQEKVDTLKEKKVAVKVPEAPKYSKNWHSGIPRMGFPTGVFDYAEVRGNGKVLDSAVIRNYARVMDNAVVQHGAQLLDYAIAQDNVEVSGQALVSGFTTLKGNTVVTGDAVIYGGIWEDCFVDSGTWDAPGVPHVE